MVRLCFDEPFSADGELFLLTRGWDDHPGYERVAALEAEFLARTWCCSADVVAELGGFVDPLRLLRRLTLRPSLDAFATPTPLSDLGPLDEPVDEAEHWIELRVLDEAHAPLPDIAVHLTQPDGKQVDGRTGVSGAFAVDGMFKGGNCKVTLPELDGFADEIIALAVDRVHTIIVPGLLFVHIRSIDFEMEPIDARPCSLRLGSRAFEAVTDADGRVSFRISTASIEAEGLLEIDTQVLGYRAPRPVAVSPLPPASEPTGQRLRLDNLGYVPPEAKPDDPPSLYAIEEFQCDHGLPVTGICDGPTRQKLVEVHGH